MSIKVHIMLVEYRVLNWSTTTGDEDQSEYFTLLEHKNSKICQTAKLPKHS